MQKTGVGATNRARQSQVKCSGIYWCRPGIVKRHGRAYKNNYGELALLRAYSPDETGADIIAGYRNGPGHRV